MKLICSVLISWSFLFFSPPSFALQPGEIVVVANGLYHDSVDLARYYMKARNIPKKNLLKIATTDRIFIDRDRYNSEIAKPVRKFLQKRMRDKEIKCLVTVRGIPLRIDPPRLSSAEKKKLEELQGQRKAISEQLKALDKQETEKQKSLKSQQSVLDAEIKRIKKKDYRAAVDSELTLVLVDEYPLKGWTANPFFVGYKNRQLDISKNEVLFVSRLDAPTVDIVKRVIDDSLAVEKEGLQGKAYIDARWKKPQPGKSLKGYAFYDNSLHLTADFIKSKKLMPVVLDDQQRLFQAGEAKDAALYSGWYSHHQYVDAFQWRKGAVGYHIASSECSTLRTGKSQVWCKRMLEEGVAATIGPVGEPYVQAFPVPEVFFRVLADGYYSLAEAYFLSVPFLSWQMILVGDPLYTPFANRLVN
ncbi:TIGR03790 family protein [Malonomonas rubra DSM 5091]|uniref:TIGR03790 family protein n=1 Tax=Malonomonas rubra DSM 5091 TaxID=1122189 RepID=A0A1M6KCG1_MALRU|nr:TIGR03790 family protein [Malonomonas rubra]SHJ56517.1 TIGR03790 family protein [Malonomonas rubra DSM 5091]